MYGECHAHIILDSVNYKNAVSLHQKEIQTSVIYQHFHAYLEKDIRFIRDGGDCYGVSQLAKTIAPSLGIDYRTPVFAIHRAGHYGNIVGKSFQTMKEYTSLVLEVKKQGGDFIKIMTAGIMDFTTDGSITGTDLPIEDVKEMIHIAHEEGFSVMVHTNGASGIRNALLAGVDSIEHGNYIDPEDIALMKETKTVWVPTLAAVYNLIGCKRFDDRILNSIWKTAKENIKMGFDAGVLFALGSDAGAYLVPHGQGLLDELTCFQRIITDETELSSRLKEGEQIIKDKFRKIS